jgi:hypothetical protein
MAEILPNFEDNLRKQIELYRQIISLEKEKQQALVANNIQEIEVITAQEEKILLEVGHLEEERLHWAEFFGQEIGKKVEEITLTEMEAYYPELENVRKEFEAEIKVLQDLHATNTKLLENAVSILNFTIQAFTQERKTTYSNPKTSGRKNVKNGKINLIDKNI